MSCAFASDLGLAKVLQNKKTYASDLKLSHKGGSSWAHVTFYGSLQRLIRTHGATGTSRKVDGTLFAFLDILAGTAGTSRNANKQRAVHLPRRPCCDGVGTSRNAPHLPRHPCCDGWNV